MADPAELPAEAEHLLIDLLIAERRIAKHRDELERREDAIAKPLTKELDAEISANPANRRATIAAAAERLAKLRRTTHRSEFAHLAGAIVTAERERARILRKLEAFPQFGEIVPAIDLAVEYDGERGFAIKTGGGRNFRFTLPMMIDRGVWRADGKYERGDCVTSDGSLWIAREDNPAHEPGKGAQWRLAVVRGRNGRDANRMRTPT